MGLGKKKMLSQGAAGGVVGTDNFQTITYTGNCNTQSTNSLLNQSGTLNFQPDLIWFKNRTGAYLHQIYNSIRGANKLLNPGVATTIGTYTGTGAERDDGGGDLTNFNASGFTIGTCVFGSVNEVGFSHVAWCWKGGGAATNITSSSTGVSAAALSANPSAGFSIATYTVNSSGSVVIPHGLNSPPSVALVKRTDSTSDWFWYNTIVPSKGRGFLNNTSAFDNSGVPTFDATNLTFQASDPFSSGSSAVIYFFADIAGYQKIGTYTANGSTTGPIVYTTDDGTATGTGGFEPRFLLIKSADNASNWIILDKARTPNNPMENDLKANLASAEQTGTGNNYPQATTSATGFQVNTTDGAVNGSGTYIYLAIA